MSGRYPTARTTHTDSLRVPMLFNNFSYSLSLSLSVDNNKPNTTEHHHITPHHIARAPRLSGPLLPAKQTDQARHKCTRAHEYDFAFYCPFLVPADTYSQVQGTTARADDGQAQSEIHTGALPTQVFDFSPSLSPSRCALIFADIDPALGQRTTVRAYNTHSKRETHERASIYCPRLAAPHRHPMAADV